MANPEDPVARRLTAILLLDVVAYSRLMGVDEVRTLTQLNAHRKEHIDPTIAGHHGRIVKLMGDGTLVEFSSIVDAVACAHEIQTGMVKRNSTIPEAEKIEFRIGINLGDVIVEDDDIYGDGVNIAARLEALAEPGGICISGMVYDALGNKLPIRYEALGEQYVKNIAQPVRAYIAHLSAASDDAKAVVSPRHRFRKWMPVAAIALAIAVGSLIVLKPLMPEPETTNLTQAAGIQTDRPSIAVLPFSNLSGEVEQEYFSDGITNDIITDLSQLSNLLVIARNSVFVYKNTPVKVQQIAAELGVTHVLEGSVQKSGNRVRINAQLIDANSGHHLWAQRFDRDLTDIFTLQDEVSKNIVAALAIELTQDEQQRLDQSNQAIPQAYDLLLKGLERFRRFTSEANAEARDYFLQAIEFDPEFARAYADVALSYAMDLQFGWTSATPEKFSTAFEYADRALELDETVGQVHFSLSMLYLMSKQHEKALESSKRSVVLHPNYADGYAQWALALNYSGKPQEALEILRKATKINPKPIFFYTWIKGQSHMLLGNPEQAEMLFLDVIERNAQFPGAHLTLAALYGEQGRIEDAQWEAAEILNLRPDFSLRKEAGNVPYKKQKNLDFYINGLRKAGLPE